MHRMAGLLGVALLAMPAGALADTIEMKVNGLVCGFCAQGIEKTLRRNPATRDVVVSLENRLVAVATREGRDIADDELRKALQDAGYDVKSIARTARSIDEIRGEIAKAR
jgi:mercuric ion binding protein